MDITELCHELMELRKRLDDFSPPEATTDSEKETSVMGLLSKHCRKSLMAK
ncbi:hypothetical protein OnM2_029010 [Erysiphe neolycopersici]|uniref:Uncharacterized protein n=1 Tax=Erysiphe neolycopersici TaxID=212602 RepID=A0A420HZP0_9PEZI|nr:hypothetical protein OnM2_029010 [Erysiphe neolycopersici]